MTKQIIALSGYARAGKDTAADVLVSEFGFTKVAFADKLREFLYAEDPYVQETFTDTAHGSGGTGKMCRNATGKYRLVSSVIDEYGWDGYKNTLWGWDLRRLLQRLGTEAGRQTLWDTIWIDAAFIGAGDAEKIVVSDARFFNEFDAVRARGGVVWRIERPGVGPVSNHPSETEAPGYSHFDRLVYNNQDIKYFEQRIREEYSMFRERFNKSQTPKQPQIKPEILAEIDEGFDEDGLRSTPLPSGIEKVVKESGVITSGYSGMPKTVGTI